jgi:hypothetical protein
MAARFIGFLAVVGALFAASARAGDIVAPQEIQALADQVDALLDVRLKETGVPPSPPASDAEFFRRLYLDLCGRIPPAAEVRDYLADDAADKQTKTVERLLSSPTHIIHSTNQWRRVLLPEADSDVEVRFTLPGFEAWLRTRIAANEPLDRIADEMLTLSLEMREIEGFNVPTAPTPIAFYRAKQGKPENLAAATARVFLGLRIECAQCHHHPFDEWKQEQFWSFAAFFQDAAPNADKSAAALHTIKITDKDITVPAAFLNGQKPNWAEAKSGRSEVSRWLLSQENPYFARSAVNRIWANLFGRGLVDPVDDFSKHNLPSHPELLDLLANTFREHKFDQRVMIRMLTATRAYRRSSRMTEPGQDDPTLFARMPVRALTPEELFDSLAQATGYRQPFDPEQPLNFNQDQTRQEFLETFSAEGRVNYEPQSTILQALALINGRFIADATSLAESRTLAAVVDAPFLDRDGKIEALFLTTLSRRPSDGERQRFTAVVEKDADPSRAYADIFWTLLNTTEFSVNH